MADSTNPDSTQDVGGNQFVTLNLTNNQAAHLWGILAGYVHDTGNELKAIGIYKQDGTLKKSRKYFSDFEQELLDNIALAELIYKHLEEVNDLPTERPDANSRKAEAQ